jgi:hypothetical protein
MTRVSDEAPRRLVRVGDGEIHHMENDDVLERYVSIFSTTPRRLGGGSKEFVSRNRVIVNKFIRYKRR